MMISRALALALVLSQLGCGSAPVTPRGRLRATLASDRRTRACNGLTRIETKLEEAGAAAPAPEKVAGKIAEVRVLGNKRLDSAQLMRIASVEPGQFITPTLVAAVIRRLWQEDELDQVAITWDESVFTIQVHEAPLIGDVYLPPGGIVANGDYGPLFGMRTGEVFRLFKLAKGLAAINAAYSAINSRKVAMSKFAYFDKDRSIVDVCLSIQ